MRNKKLVKNGFSLLEFLMVLIILLIVTVVALPFVLYAIKWFRINAFRSSAYNVLDAVKYHVTNTGFNNFPDEGIPLEELNLELENNKFDSGLVKKLNEDDYELVNLSRNNYCASGTANNMKATDSGCGALDKTKPNVAYVYLKNATNDSISVIASGVDDESTIKYYQFSIDGSKYTKKQEVNEYTFNDLSDGEHTIKVKITNEAGLSKTSKKTKIKTRSISKIECYEKNNKISYQTKKSFICKYPVASNYKYEYSLDNDKWESITLDDENTYTFDFNENKTIYTRVLNNDEVVGFKTITVSLVEKTLNGAYPELLDNMIPVVYDNEKNSWVKADTRTIYFNYADKSWANAILVGKGNAEDKNSKSRDYYLSDEAIGNTIYEGDILGFYVWIPRYKYKVFNVNNKSEEPSEIDIVFENKNTSKSIKEESGSYLTHPAFSYNNEINGFWVSKFQNSAALTSSCYNDNNECDSTSISLYSLPIDNKITNISISNAHLNALNMNKEDNIYGLSEDTNPHILTNLEWGAISYLANSKYGINKNITTNGKIYKENLENSTTGNIMGVFEMSGLNQEMVMGNYNQDSGKTKDDNSGFKDYGQVDWPTIIDYYSGITSKNRILGDATGETTGWYDSYAKFVNGEYPFFTRGGIIEGKASIYNYNSYSGSKNNMVAFRTSLSN